MKFSRPFRLIFFVIYCCLPVVKSRGLSVPWDIRGKKYGQEVSRQIVGTLTLWKETDKIHWTEMQVPANAKGGWTKGREYWAENTWLHGRLIAPFIWHGAEVCYVRHSQYKFPDKGYVEDARKMLVFNDMTHHWGSPGNHLMTKFQCDVYHFRNVQVRNPMSHKLEDDILKCAIGWSTLDAFCSRIPRAVKKIW